MSAARAPSGPPADYFDGRRFFNPGLDLDRSGAEFRRWRRERRPAPWPERLADPPRRPPPAAVGADEIAVTFIGQASFLVQAAGVNALTDPIFSERASPLARLGPRRVRPPAIALADLPPIHLVLLSHNHYDHMDLPSLRALARRWDPLIVTGLGNGRYLARKGVGRAHELGWWEATAHAGLAVTFVPAQHWSRRGLFDRRRTLWGGHVLETPAGRLYFAGDTGYPAAFAAIRERLGAPDLALLPIGAYEPRWFMRDQHMNPEDAVRAHRDLGAAQSLAMHFATFPLTDEAIDAPAAALGAALAVLGVPQDRFLVPGFGATLRWRRAPGGSLAGPAA